MSCLMAAQSGDYQTGGCFRETPLRSQKDPTYPVTSETQPDPTRHTSLEQTLLLRWPFLSLSIGRARVPRTRQQRVTRASPFCGVAVLLRAPPREAQSLRG
jgi:hypothetical protein